MALAKTTPSPFRRIFADGGNLSRRRRLQASGINAAGFALEKLPETLVLRGWREGDQMIPFGKNSAVKLKKIFTDAKISPEKKKATPLLCLPDGTVIWVAGVRRSSFAPVEPDKQAMIFYI